MHWRSLALTLLFLMLQQMRVLKSNSGGNSFVTSMESCQNKSGLMLVCAPSGTPRSPQSLWPRVLGNWDYGAF